MLLTANLTELQLNKFGTAEIRNEVYLVTIGMDLAKTGQYMAPDDLMPEDFADKHSWMIFGVSPLFEKVHRGDFLHLTGDGFLLYGPKDPQGKLCLHTAVMESDSDHRQAAKKITEFFANAPSITDPLRVIKGLSGVNDLYIRAATAAIRYIFESVLYFLKHDDDDVIGTFHYSSTARKDRPKQYKTGMFDFEDRYIDGSIEVIVENNLRALPDNPYEVEE